MAMRYCMDKLIPTRFYLLLVRTFERYACLPLLRQHTPEPSQKIFAHEKDGYNE